MSLFFRYLLKEFIKTLLFLLILFLFFFLVVDFFEKLSSFLKRERAFFFFLSYLFWKIPVGLHQIYPYALALSSLLSLFFLSRSRELLALISLGITRKEIYKKYVFLIFFFSLFGGLVLNTLLPVSYYKAIYIWETQIEGKRAEHLIFGNTLFFEGENFFIVATPLEPKGEYLADFTMVLLKEGEPEKLILARRALYKGDNLWEFDEAIIQEAKEDFKPRMFKTISERLFIKPKTFVTIEKSVRFASLKELGQRYYYLKKVGKPQTEVIAELLNRLFYLFSGFLLGIIPLWLYLKEYTPSGFGFAFLKALMAFLLLSALFLSLQTMLYKSFGITLFLLVLFCAFVLVKFFSELFFQRSP